ncbi:hypothetical protein HDV03_002439 [Kappamyces sp. JEL0829]|nr:hypothetical protein HDV03_002439 [Kappamyces sp. JEL0829]
MFFIDVLSFAIGESNSGSTHAAGGAGSGKPSFKDMSLTKYVDKATPALLSAVAKGTRIPKATLYVRNTNNAAAKPLTVLQYDLEEVLISSSNIGGTGDDSRITESITINYAKVTVSYVPVDSKGTAGAAIKSCFDITTNVAC